VDQQRRAECAEKQLKAFWPQLWREVKPGKATEQTRPNPAQVLMAAAIKNISRSMA